MDYSNNPRVKIDSDGTMYVDGVEVRVKEIVTEDKKSMNIAYRDLKNSFDLGAVSAEEFYAELEVLRDYYLEEGSAAWWNYTKRILAYEQSLFEEQEKAEADMLDRKVSRLSAMYSMGAISAQQYYDELTSLRDSYFSKESKEWESFTVSLAEFYAKQLETIQKKSDSLTDRLTGGIMHHVTVKDNKGNITDSFYRLMSPDVDAAKDFFEGYRHLQDNGAPAYILDEYLGMPMDKSAEYISALDNLGTYLPDYFSALTEKHNAISAMSDNFYGTDNLASLINEIVHSLGDAGFNEGIEINQNFYGDNFSPADVAQKVVDTLRLQGVEF